MELYPEDILAAIVLVLSAALALFAGAAYARARLPRLLVPLISGFAVMAVAAFLTVRGSFSTEPPAGLDLPVSLTLLAVIIVLTIVWLVGGRAGRPDRGNKG